MNRLYGWKPDKPDLRDKLYQPVAFANLPQKVDLRQNCSSVKDQGNLGSCTANSITSALEFLDKKNKIKTLRNYSRLFIYLL